MDLGLSLNLLEFLLKASLLELKLCQLNRLLFAFNFLYFSVPFDCMVSNLFTEVLDQILMVLDNIPLLSKPHPSSLESLKGFHEVLVGNLGFAYQLLSGLQLLELVVVLALLEVGLHQVL